MKIKEQSPFIAVEVLQGLATQAKQAKTTESKLVRSQTYEVVEMIFNFQRNRQAPRG